MWSRPGWSRNQEHDPDLCHGWQDSSTWPSCAVSLGLRRELYQRWSTWLSDLCCYGKPAWKVGGIAHCATALALRVKLTSYQAKSGISAIWKFIIQMIIVRIIWPLLIHCSCFLFFNTFYGRQKSRVCIFHVRRIKCILGFKDLQKPVNCLICVIPITRWHSSLLYFSSYIEITEISFSSLGLYLKCSF